MSPSVKRSFSADLRRSELKPYPILIGTISVPKKLQHAVHGGQMWALLRIPRTSFPRLEAIIGTLEPLRRGSVKPVVEVSLRHSRL